MNDIIAELVNVSRIFDNGRIVALNNINIRITRGEWLTITGPSGSGKSTILHLLSGLDFPTEGEVIFEGIKKPGSRRWVQLRSERIGYVFQSFNLLPMLTAAENVEIPLIGVIGKSRHRTQRAIELLSQVGLADRSKYRPGELSGGERQRVAVARALANSPDFILADEPTGNLDTKNSHEIIDLLETIHERQKTTLVIVTHEEQIASRGGRRIKCVDGKIMSDTSGHDNEI